MCHLKLEVGSADLRDSGRQFQTVGPATQKALSTNFVLVRVTMYDASRVTVTKRPTTPITENNTNSKY